MSDSIFALSFSVERSFFISFMATATCQFRKKEKLWKCWKWVCYFPCTNVRVVILRRDSWIMRKPEHITQVTSLTEISFHFSTLFKIMNWENVSVNKYLNINFHLIKIPSLWVLKNWLSTLHHLSSKLKFITNRWSLMWITFCSNNQMFALTIDKLLLAKFWNTIPSIIHHWSSLISPYNSIYLIISHASSCVKSIMCQSRELISSLEFCSVTFFLAAFSLEIFFRLRMIVTRYFNPRQLGKRFSTRKVIEN